MRTTLTLEPDVAAKLKAEMRRTGHSFKHVVNELLRERLIQRDMPGPRPRFKVRARDLGLRPGFSYDCISALLEQIEGPGHK
jgi:hypothetical protein